MFEECVDKVLIDAIDLLADSTIISKYNFYLAGGTSLALQLGHRESYDLDFFTQDKFRVDYIIAELETSYQVRVINSDEDTLNCIISKGEDECKLSFFRTMYPLMSPTVRYRNIALANIEDIAAMKMIAIAQRGSKKDFVDIYHILRDNRMTFEDIIKTLKTKYVSVNFNLPLILRSLGYFVDADNDLDPKMKNHKGSGFDTLGSQEWARIKQFLLKIQKDKFGEAIQ